MLEAAAQGGRVKTIIVGIDGSETSRRALDWAIDEARLRGDHITAVQAWDFLVPIGPAGMVAAPYVPAIDFEAEARAALANVVKECSGGSEDPPIEEVVVRGSAAHALIRFSKIADLLVVGARGLGGFGGLLLGSVSQQCVHHAHCPVVVVPHAPRSETQAR
jgi:nucleotide-binding universal stress UspA family protein